MAIASVGTMGTGVSSTSSTTFTLTTATNALASGDFAILVVTSDNTSTADANSSDHTSVSGGTGTWSKLGEYTNGNGAANAGVTTSLWLFQATGTVSIGTVITITLAAAKTDKVASMWKFTKATGQSIRLDPDAATNPITNGIDAANGFGSVAFSGLPSQQRLYFRGLGKEANTTTAITVSANFTAVTGNRSRNNTAAITLRGEFRINTSTGETSNPTLAVTGDTAGVFVALEEFTPPAAQSLTQDSRYDNTNTFYTHTVTTGAVTLTQGTRYDNTNTFYTPNVAASGNTQDLLPSLYTNNNVIYSPTVNRGIVTLTAARYDNNQVFYSGTVTRGAVDLTVPLLTNNNTFYSSVVSSAGITLGPERYDNNQVFYTASVSVGSVDIAPDLFNNTSSFYSATVSTFGSTQFITFPDWVDPGWVEPGWVEWPYFNTNTFPTHTLAVGAVTLTPSRFDNTNTFYTHDIEVVALELLPELFTNNNSFYVHQLVNQYPDPRYVLKGIVYGPGLVGEYEEGIKVELTTGQLVKPLNSKVAIFL